MRNIVLVWCVLFVAAPTAAFANCPPGQRCATAPTPRPAPVQRAAPAIRQAPAPRPQVVRPSIAAAPHGQAQRPALPAPGRNERPIQRVGGEPGGHPNDSGFNVRPSTPNSRFGAFGADETHGPQSGPSAGAGPGVGHPHGGAEASDVRHSSSGAVFKYHGHSYARFVAPRYEWPHGLAYQRLEVGQRIAHIFWRPAQFLDDYADYGLADPPYGFEWVRYGPDVLLIDLNTGIVGQVIYGVFDEGPPPDGE